MQYLFGSEIPTLAFRFRDYIRAQFNVELLLREVNDKNGPQIQLFLSENTPHFAAILAEVPLFLADPLHAKYEQASWQRGDTFSTHTSLKGILQQSGLTFSTLLNRAQTGPFTFFITVLCLLIYLFQLSGYQDSILNVMHYPENTSQDTQVWRYLSHTLVHLSPLHILFNLIWWWLFGHMIERHFGTGKVVQLFLIAGSLSGVAQNLASGPYFFGLSGVVYAVLGYVFIYDKWGKKAIFTLPSGFSLMLMVGIVSGFISPLFGVEMGNTAHITGLIVGFLLAGITIRPTRKG
ncbi:rhomboid family intramembrane serine protease [Bisgaard Taxon 45]